MIHNNSFVLFPHASEPSLNFNRNWSVTSITALLIAMIVELSIHK